MKMSNMAMKTKKGRGSEEALSLEMLFQAGMLKRHSTGIYGLGNLLVRAMQNIETIIRDVMERYDCPEVSMPILQPKQLWVDSGRWDIFAVSGLMFNMQGRDNHFCLAPSGEEIVVDYMRQYIESYRDLPINIYQIGQKFRDEIRTRGGLIRGKEFRMKDGYSFHATFEDMLREYARMKQAYDEIFAKLDLGVIPVSAINAEMGGRVSEEYMFPLSLGQDKILIERSSGLAFNVEVLEQSDTLAEIVQKHPDLDIKGLEEVNCVELGHVFQLGDYYSKKMNGCFIDKDGQKRHYYMASYGIGITRTLAVICENNCDERGLVWPLNIAPYLATIIYTNENTETAFEFYNEMNRRGIPTVIDDRDNRFGFKINDWYLMGIPYLLILGKNYQEGSLEVEVRQSKSKIGFCSIGEFINFIKESVGQG